MSTITSLNSTDSGATSRGVINTNFTNLNTDKLEASDIAGKVTGAASSTDNAIARFDGITGKVIQNSGVVINDLDNNNYRITTPDVGDATGVSVTLRGGGATAGNNNGGTGAARGGLGFGSGSGGVGTVTGGQGGATGAGGIAQITGGAGGATSGNGGDANMNGGNATAGNSNGGNVSLRPGLKSGSGTDGLLLLYPASLTAPPAVIDLTQLATAAKTFTFPNETGTIAVGTPWTTWTPTFANFTKGSATITARYTMIGKTVHFVLSVVLAADSSMGSSPTFSLPVTSVDGSYGTTSSQIGQATHYDAGTGFFTGPVVWASTTTAAIRVTNAGGTYATINDVTATVPMTWTTNDGFFITGSYEAA